MLDGWLKRRTSRAHSLDGPQPWQRAAFLRAEPGRIETVGEARCCSSRCAAAAAVTTVDALSANRGDLSMSRRRVWSLSRRDTISGAPGGINPLRVACFSLLTLSSDRPQWQRAIA